MMKMEIKNEDINKDIRIINSFEQCKREYKWNDNKDDRFEFLCSTYSLDIPPCRLVTVENDFNDINGNENQMVVSQ